MDRPLAEQYWHADITRLGGSFPSLQPLPPATLVAMKRALRARPDCVERRVVGTTEGRAIWYWIQRGAIRWYVLSDEQDAAMQSLGER